MKSIRLSDNNGTYFQEAWKLYEESFPLFERRTFSKQQELLKKNEYRYDMILYQEQLLGFILWWSFDEFRFVEHYAIASGERGKGFGKHILEAFIRNDDRPVLLEVDLPDNEISKNRIRFYENLGFKLNLHFYQQPSLREECDPVELYLMSYPLEISEGFVFDFVEIYHPIIYGNC